jgi:predicted DNA-binding transcriptional regulator AlpA
MGDTMDDPSEFLLNSGDVRRRCGNVSLMSLFRWLRDPTVAFPRPDIVISKRNYWRESTIAAWLASRAPRRPAADAASSTTADK